MPSSAPAAITRLGRRTMHKAPPTSTVTMPTPAVTVYTRLASAVGMPSSLLMCKNSMARMP